MEQSSPELPTDAKTECWVALNQGIWKIVVRRIFSYGKAAHPADPDGMLLNYQHLRPPNSEGTIRLPGHLNARRFAFQLADQNLHRSGFGNGQLNSFPCLVSRIC
jgi:hypothetical protein